MVSTVPTSFEEVESGFSGSGYDKRAVSVAVSETEISRGADDHLKDGHAYHRATKPQSHYVDRTT